MERGQRCPRCSCSFDCDQDLLDHGRHIHDALMVPFMVPGRGHVCPNCGVVRNAEEMRLHSANCEVSLECDEDLPSFDGEHIFCKDCEFATYDSQVMAQHAKTHAQKADKKRQAAPRPKRARGDVSDNPPRQKRARGHVSDDLDAIFSKMRSAVEGVVGSLPDAPAGGDNVEKLRAELDIVSRERDILREALQASRDRVRLLEDLPPAALEGLHASVEAKVRASATVSFSTWARTSSAPYMLSENTKVCPPIVILEAAFPGKGLSLIKAQATRSRKDLQSVVDGKIIDAAIKKVWRESSLMYHPDKSPHLPAEAMSLLNAQYARLKEIFGSPAPSYKSVHEFHRYCERCLSLLSPGKPWRTLWDHLMSDPATDSVRQDHVERWIGERVSLVKQILAGDRIDSLDRYVGCLSQESYPGKVAIVKDAPSFPFDQ